MLQHALAALILLAPALPSRADTPPPEETAPPADEFVVAAGTDCRIDGRDLNVHVKERVDARERTAAWLLEACVTGKDLPTSCLAAMTASTPLPAGMDASGRSFLVRCVPAAKLAWVVDLLWTQDGLELQAWRLDLKPLVEAPIIDGEGGLKEIALKPGAQLVPEEPHAWKAGDPRPLPACVPLGLEATATGEDLEVIIRAASTECTSWNVRYDGARGSFTASPLPGSAPPDLLRDVAGGPLRMEPGHATPPPAAAPAAPPIPTGASAEEAQTAASAARKPSGHGWSSFSRR